MRNSIATVRKAQRGLTLLEIMIVIAILGLLVVIVAPKVMGAFGKSKVDIAQIKVKDWKSQYERWEVARNQSHDKACTDVKLFEDVGKFADKDMTAEELEDPWGKPIQIFCDESGFKGIYSFGENNKDEKGAGDDVTSWSKPKQPAQ